MTVPRGKLVLITGAGMGMGKRLAGKFAADGARLVLYDINKEAMEKTREELVQRYKTEVFTYVCDLGNKEEIDRVGDEVLANHGTVDVLVNNAGIVFGGRFLDFNDEQIQKTMDINAMGVIWNTKKFIHPMAKKGEGHLIQIASAAGLMGNSGMAVYCASKHAVVGFNEALRLELKRSGLKNIKTTCVCPAFIDTGMFKGVKAALLMPWLKEEAIVDKIYNAFLNDKPMLAEPFMVKLIPLFRVITTPNLLDAIGGVLKINKSMDTFKGHGK